MFFIIFRKSSSVTTGHSTVIRNQQSDIKRVKTEGQSSVDKITKNAINMIDLDLVSSDDDF